MATAQRISRSVVGASFLRLHRARGLARMMVAPTRGLASVQGKAETTLQSEHIKRVFRSMAMQDDDMRNDLSYSLAFANINRSSSNYHKEDSDHNDEESGAWQFSVISDPRMRSQLERSRNQCLVTPSVSSTFHIDDEPLPQTMSEALRPSPRAIVITERTSPFRIWNVNQAWEKLCGYTFLESRGKTLGSLLQGEETDTVAATNLVAKLLQGEEDVGTTLVNYHKDGSRFVNRIRVGPIYDDENHRVTHFIGVLQEMKA